MVRTRSFGVKAGGKSSKKTTSSSAPASSASSSSGSKKGENGNAVQVQPTPAWQREITGFLDNPAKKPRLEDTNSSTEEIVMDAEIPEKSEELSDEKVEDNSANGKSLTQESNAAGESKNLSEKETELDPSGQASNGSVESANGCKNLVKDSEIVKEDKFPKNGTLKNDANGSDLPDLAEGGKNIE